MSNRSISGFGNILCNDVIPQSAVYCAVHHSTVHSLLCSRGRFWKGLALGLCVGLCAWHHDHAIWSMRESRRFRKVLGDDLRSMGFPWSRMGHRVETDHMGGSHSHVWVVESRQITWGVPTVTYGL